VPTHSSQACAPGSPVKGIRVSHTKALPGVIFYRGTDVNHRYPRHWHDELHVCAYDGGSGYLLYKGSSYQCRPGDVAITPPGEVHENLVTSGAGVTFRSVYVPISLLHSVSEQLDAKHRELPIRLSVAPSDLGRRLLATYQAIEDGASVLACEQLWLDFLLCLVEQRSASRVRIGQDPARVSKVRDYIEAHFTRSISLNELAGVAGVSVCHLNRLFSANTGLPPHEYQTQLRINYAKRLLQRRVRSADVAVFTGFTDQSHLTRHFKRLVGVTPARFSA
jgi:AraC-like DNA-binding protein